MFNWGEGKVREQMVPRIERPGGLFYAGGEDLHRRQNQGSPGWDSPPVPL